VYKAKKKEAQKEIRLMGRNGLSILSRKRICWIDGIGILQRAINGYGKN